MSMHATAKQVLLTVLVVAFMVQTALVYGDDRSEPLDRLALQGRKIWHRQACQVCHQLWGQGGFLGPDLTNAARRVDSVRMSTLLSVGSRQMPAFHLSTDEIAAVRAYLTALDRPERGRGQVRLGRPDGTGWERLERVASPLLDEPATTAARDGWTTFRTRPCQACHQPLTSGVGGAPDLATSVARLGPDSLRAVLIAGRPERGMPPPMPAFSTTELENMVAFITWLGTRRDTLGALLRASEPKTAIRWRDLPWWEYR